MCTNIQEEIYYERLDHEIGEADKSHNQQKRRKASVHSWPSNNTGVNVMGSNINRDFQ